MTFTGFIIVSVCLVFAAVHYWREFCDDGDPARQRLLLAWVLKGVIGPAVVWILANADLSLSLPPLLPEVADARAAGGSRIALILLFTGRGLMVIASYWTALTFAWLAVLLFGRAGNRTDFISLSLFWLLFGSPIVWLIVRSSGWAGIGFGALVWLLPIVHCTLSLAPVKKRNPIYSRAVAKMKLGKYTEAEVAVIGELEKCEQDFEGWMMLADLYANQFNDLAEADRTVRELCHQQNTNSVQISLALHRLADWHLKIGENPAAARSALELVQRKLPGSHFARMAQLRIDQLPSSREELIEQRTTKPIRLPALSDSFDDEGSQPATSEITKADAVSMANQCVEKLKRDPNNIAERDKLARIFAERLGKLDLAIEQLELLMAMPNQPNEKIAEWLSRIAVWQLKYRGDAGAARKILQRLIKEFPQSAQAFAAQRRLSLMEMDDRIPSAKTEATVSRVVLRP